MLTVLVLVLLIATLPLLALGSALGWEGGCRRPMLPLLLLRLRPPQLAGLLPIALTLPLVTLQHSALAAAVLLRLPA